MPVQHHSYHYTYLHNIPSWWIYFCCLRIFLGWPIVTRLLKFPPNKYQTCSASSSIVCFFHGIPVTYMAYLALSASGQFRFDENFKAPFWSDMPVLNSNLSAYPAELKSSFSLVMSYSCGYMLYDLTFMLINSFYYPVSAEPNFVDFIQHHIGCVVYMYSVSYFEAGYTGLMLLMFLGEVTNPFQNIMNIANAGQEYFKSPSVYDKIEQIVQPVFGILFAFVRLVIGGMLIFIFSYIYLYHNIFKVKTEERHIPFTLGIIWVSAILAMVVGSANFAIENLIRAIELITGSERTPYVVLTGKEKSLGTEKSEKEKSQ
ncbi:hypothetical protein TrVE_jg3394 [Triparma verrucosa]|uniref:TLC domain-containing protein n=1 Tax=Triparma verrucosa TaxID=1606542 RepID=A0A9W7B9N6_9STRA|nr:hypothetical protein TrVE_jg3394 [Triparma verrucosa]